MIRLYVAQTLVSGLVIELSSQQIHYLLHVMRVRDKTPLLLFNGEEGEWLAHITALTKRHCKAQIVEQQRPQPLEDPLWLLFPPLKPKALSYLLEKATEAGVTDLQPVLTDHTAVMRFNQEKAHLQTIEASEQCDRLSIPRFHPLSPLSKILSTWPRDLPLYVGDETHASPALIRQRPKGPCAFMIGPEGGWSPAELKMFKEMKGILTVDLGEMIYRAETAALVGLATLQQIRRNK